MAVKSPEDMDPTFEAAFNARDGETLLSLYDPEAAFVVPSGETIIGPAAIAEVLGPFFEMDPQMDLRTEKILRNGDTALVYSTWSVTGTGPDGPIVMTGNSTVVVREQADGTWKFVIDDPGWNA